LQIPFENWICLNAIVKTFEILFQFGCPIFRQRINHPVLLLLGDDHPSVPKVSQVLGNLHLWFTKNILNMTNAEPRLRQEMEDAQPGSIAKALINLNQINHSY